MKYVILAAGRGTRLAPLTDNKHKAFVKYNGKELLFHLMDHIKEEDEVLIVVGHRKEEVIMNVKERYPRHTISFVENPDFSTTGTAHSLWFAKDFAKNGFIYSNCDVVPDKRMMDALYHEGSVMFIDHTDSFRNTMMKFSPEAAQALFALGHAKHERAYDRIFKIMGEHNFKTVDITGFDWREVDEPKDLE